MIAISKEQARIRFRTLPPKIQDSIFSEEDADLVRKIAQDNHLSEDKMSDMARILSYIFLGFIRAGDLKKHLEEDLHINHQAADYLAKTVDAQLIDPFRGDLEKIYRPLNEADFGLAPDRRQIPRKPVAPTPLPNISSKVVILEVEKGPKASNVINIPRPPSPAPKPAPATPNAHPGPFMFTKKPENQPIQTPQNFKLSHSVPIPPKNSIPTPPPAPRPARVELGKINAAAESISVVNKAEIEREPIRYSEPKPKNIFMPPVPPPPQK